MSALLEHLAAALTSRYTIERELGHGGMARVYLAQDRKLHRPVAIKAFRPELTAALGVERFLREIEIASRLHHPHILPLLESGEADGLLYYVMPYVAGDSLRDRLMRERQLPLSDTIEISRQVADALHFAHRQDLVHRDVKPENILLADTGAMVADFGIARAITMAGGEQLTSTGVVVGTPAYMSPEQGAGEPHLDGRSDVFSLGCVVYEMLSGTPPFLGSTAQAIQARRMADPVPPLRTVRELIPEPVEAAIERALAKVPADRFATPTEFAAALTMPGAVPRRTARERIPWARALRAPPRRIVAALAALVTVITLVVVAFVWEPRRSVNEPADAGLVAVFPFRVVGADPAVGYLREGMVDLLAVKLNGEGGPRALDPRALLGAWHRAVPSTAEDLSPDAAVVVARRLGAGRLVDGAVVGTPSHLMLTAEVVDVPSGTTRARASVAGTADSLPALIDRLTAAILAGESGRTELATLTSLPALRAYLDGQSAIRAGRFKDAFQSFNHALELDSTFALAGIGLGRARFWDGGDDSGRGFRVAWAARDRLSPRDLAIIAPWMVPGEEHLATAERAVVTIPESPEAWYELGDDYYHGGALEGMDAPLRQAAAAFRRALELDSSFAEPRMHLFDIAAAEGDTAEVRRFGNMVMAADSTNDFADYVRWQMAVALHDTVGLVGLRARFDRMNEISLVQLTMRSQAIGIAQDDARRAVAALLKRADTKAAYGHALHAQYVLAMNGGRPREGLAAATEPEQSSDNSPPDRIKDALYWDGDSAAAEREVRLRARRTRVLASGAEDRRAQYTDICFVQQWRLAHGDLGTVPAAIARLRAAVVPGLPAADSIVVTASAANCATLLEAWLATAARQPDAAVLVARLDSLSRRTWGWTFNLAVARLLEAHGYLPDALAAVRRRQYGSEPLYLSTYLRDEGHLAALVGDTVGAIKAYRRYLALRFDPEPPLRAQRDSVSAELSRLGGVR